MAIASFRAGEAISAGDFVYVSAAGFLYKASAIYQDQASSIGVAIDSGSPGSLIRVNSDALYTSFSGLTPGEYQYLSVTTSGAAVTYSGWEATLSTTAYPGAYLTVLGRAVTTTSVEVEISKPLFVLNPTSIMLLESSAGITLDAILLEDGSTIDLETASV
jgi:hypothetical protein